MPIYPYSPVALPVLPALALPDEPPTHADSAPLESTFPRQSDFITALSGHIYRLRLKLQNCISPGNPRPSKYQVLQPAEINELQCYRLMGRLAGVIEQHKINLGEVTPEAILRGAMHRFNQQQVLVFALKLVGKSSASEESVEVCLSLASQLAERGVDLGAWGDKRLHTQPQVTFELGFVNFIKRELDSHWVNRSPDFLASFDNDLGVASALRSLFAEDFQELLEDRHWLEGEITDILWNPASSDLQRRTAHAQLEMLENLEKDWYRTKTLEVLSRLLPAPY